MLANLRALFGSGIKNTTFYPCVKEGVGVMECFDDIEGCIEESKAWTTADSLPKSPKSSGSGRGLRGPRNKGRLLTDVGIVQGSGSSTDQS